MFGLNVVNFYICGFAHYGSDHKKVHVCLTIVVNETTNLDNLTVDVDHFDSCFRQI